MTSHDAGRWMLELIGVGLGYPVAGNRGTHSCKATGLSWPARAGVRKDLRRTLGYHVAVDEVSTFTYSRDSQAEPLRALAEVIRLIRVGQFNPDETRSGRFTNHTSFDDSSILPVPLVLPSSSSRQTSPLQPTLPRPSEDDVTS